ncbi:MAG: hypothetical protein ACOYL6_10070 [Bacteriovoracaceae bacterium]
MNVLSKLLPLILILASLPAFAKRFTNQYCEFELPNGWECALEGSEWVCQSENEERKKEAIIILAAKVRGEQDSLDQYQLYLKTPKTYNLPGGKTQVSEGKYSNVKEINGHQWVDALHLASEVPGFYTRYLATVKEDLGVAVTFSVSKDHYQAYQAVFDKVVASLRVFRQKQMDMAGIKKSGESVLDDSSFVPEDKVDVSQAKVEKKKSGGGSDDLMLYGLVAAAAVAFFVIKKKKK